MMLIGNTIYNGLGVLVNACPILIICPYHLKDLTVKT